MSRPIKFRYANEIAGAFVILAMALFVGAVFLAGRSQGWFEGKFDLLVEFDTAEGSFGLQEGGEVWVMNTVAGRVARITPTGAGGMRGHLVLQNRYLPFISTDSIARVKRKFGLAGDAYVEIGTGNGAPVTDGAVIPGVKDEELMDTARKMLEKMERDLQPMIADAKQLLGHANTISGTIAAGEGLAGSAIHDKEMTEAVKQMLRGANALILDSSEAIKETTRLVKGVQKHWLVRKYIEDPAPDAVLSTVQLEGTDADRAEAARAWDTGVVAGRIADSPAHVAANALNLGYVCLEADRLDACEKWLFEAGLEMAASGMDLTRARLLRAELERRRGHVDVALGILTGGAGPGRGASRAERAAWKLQAARAYLAADRIEDARAARREAERQARKSDLDFLAAAAAAVAGELALIDRCPAEAAELFDRAAAGYRASSLYGAMSRELARAGRAYESASDLPEAFHRFYRAYRSAVAAGHEAPQYLAAARRIARTMPSKVLLSRLDSLYTTGPKDQ